MRCHYAILLGLVIFSTALGIARADDDFLPADEAFRFSTQVSGGQFELHWAIAEGYALYRDRIHLQVVTPSAVSAQIRIWPASITHQDEFFGPQEIYRNSLLIKAPLVCSTGVKQVTIEVKYQGCADKGLCYPPETKQVAVNLPEGACGA